MVLEMYRLTDIQTHTVLENLTLKQVASNLGVRTGYVKSCVKNNNLIRFRYKVEVISSIEVKSSDIPIELWEEWDRVCKPLNKVLRKHGKDIVITTID